jgi:uncharacterized protein YprB with RNaseH-like and TPR domain
MLESTFIHVPGIGPSVEQKLWKRGVHSWAHYLDALTKEEGKSLGLSWSVRALGDPVIEESVERLGRRDFKWFASALPAREHWRAWRPFSNRVAYVDIETNGGFGPQDLTVVGMYDGSRMRHFVKGDNLEEFPEAVSRAEILVSFFGTGFDLPFLRRAFRMEFPQLHIDLCPLLKRLGYQGGLKRVEAALGLERSVDTTGLDGMDAVRLWRQYQMYGSEKSLQTLLDYNAEDVVNMERLLEIAIDRMEHGLLRMR